MPLECADWTIGMANAFLTIRSGLKKFSRRIEPGPSCVI